MYLYMLQNLKPSKWYSEKSVPLRFLIRLAVSVFLRGDCAACSPFLLGERGRLLRVS